MSIYSEPFTYSDQLLNNTPNWSGDLGNEFQVVSNHVECVSHGYTSIITDNSINGDATKVTVFKGHVGMGSAVSNWRGKSMFYLYSAGSVAIGLLFETYSGNNNWSIFTYNGSSHVLAGQQSMSANVFYPFSFIIDKNQNKLIDVTLNEINYGDRALPALGNFSSVEMRRWSYVAVGIGYYDSLELSTIGRNKYKCFPRWQKTKYGLRPCY